MKLFHFFDYCFYRCAAPKFAQKFEKEEYYSGDYNTKQSINIKFLVFSPNSKKQTIMPHSNKLIKLFLFSFFVFFFSFSYSTPLCESIKRDTISKPQKVKIDPKLRLGAQAGYGYRIAKFPSTPDPNMNKHLKKLKHNLSFGADLSYYFKDYLGVGVKYNANVTHTVTENVSSFYPDGTHFFYKQFSELIGTHYAGAFLSAQFFTIPQKQCILANVGAGYLRYENYTNSLNEEITRISKNSAAIFVEIGYDFFVSKRFAIGLQTSGLIDLKKEKIPNIKNMSHIDVSLGFRFYN